MKKKWIVCILLTAAVLLGTFPVPTLAAETTTETTEYVPPTETVPDANAQAPANDAPFGSTSQLYGCRSIDGEKPLAGTDRILEGAQAAFVYEINTRTVVYAYNPDLELRPGALSKIMTALLAIEMCGMDDVVTVSSRNISRLPAGSINKNLKEAEELTVRDLVYCLLLEQANDAAIAIAEHVAGNMNAFVELMNQRAKQIGCDHTEFANVHGLDNMDQHTTARDMAKIVAEAVKNDDFREAFGTVEYKVPETNRSEERPLLTTNYLIDNHILQVYMDERVTGGMQSYVSAASGAGLVCTAKSRDERMNYVMVVLGSPRTYTDRGTVERYGNFDDMQDLLQYVFNNFKINRVLYEGQAFEQFPVIGGTSDVVAQIQVNVDSILPVNAHMENLIREFDIIGGPTAPIEKGQKIGTMELWYRDSCLMEAELFAMEGVKSTEDPGLTVRGLGSEKSSNSHLSKVVWIVCLVIIVPVVGYLVINSYLRQRSRAMRRRRRASRRRSH